MSHCKSPERQTEHREIGASRKEGPEHSNFPVSSHDTQTSGSEVAVTREPQRPAHDTAVTNGWQPSLAGSDQTDRDRARLCSSAWGLPRAPSDIRLLCHRPCPSTRSPQTGVSWSVTLLLDLYPLLSTITLTLAMLKRNATIWCAMLEGFLPSPKLLGIGLQQGIDGRHTVWER